MMNTASAIAQKVRGEIGVQFEPDTVLPEQFFDTYRGAHPVEGERRLMLAVIEDALECYRKHCISRGPHERQLYQEARDWIASNERHWCFSFENICETLEINPEYLRSGLRRWREKHIAQSRVHVVRPDRESAIS